MLECGGQIETFKKEAEVRFSRDTVLACTCSGSANKEMRVKMYFGLTESRKNIRKNRKWHTEETVGPSGAWLVSRRLCRVESSGLSLL